MVETRDFIGLFAYLLSCGIIIGFGESLRRAHGRAEENHQAALDKQRQFAEAEERIRSVVHNVIDGIIAIDERGMVQSLNPAAEKLFGFKAEEVIGQNVKMLMPDPYRSEHDAYIANYLRTGQAKIIGIGREVEGRRKDGSTFPMELAVSEFRLGEKRYFTGVVRDITERKRFEEQARKNQEIFKLVHGVGKIGHWQWNSQTDENKWSPEIEALYGLEPGTFEGTYDAWARLLHPDDLAGAEADVRRAMETGKYFAEFRVIWPDGSVHWLEARAHVFRDEHNKPERIVGVNMEITERKQIEDALKEAHRRKDEFLATLAHELRNPLAPIRNSVELLRHAANDPGVMADARTIMERQLGHMVRLVDDLLDISRVTSGKLHLRKERVELAAPVHSAVEETRRLIETSGHELTITLPPEPVFLDADPTRLAQIFSNLLNNAAKYMDKGGHIWLTAERWDGDISVSVRDTGIGIAAEHLPHIFEMFSQVTPALERSQGGLGIGLALVRGLVELHGGTIEARSSGPGMGSEFIVRLPIVDLPSVPQGQEPENTGDKSQAGQRRRILVVDDNVDTANSLAMVLRRMGHDILTAHDGLEAVHAAANFRPEVILLDIGLPKMNGYDVAKQIRQQPWDKKVAIIAVSGWGQEEDKRRALEAGFDHHLTKPVEPAALSKLLALIAPS